MIYSSFYDWLLSASSLDHARLLQAVEEHIAKFSFSQSCTRYNETNIGEKLLARFIQAFRVSFDPFTIIRRNLSINTASSRVQSLTILYELTRFKGEIDPETLADVAARVLDPEYRYSSVLFVSKKKIPL